MDGALDQCIENLDFRSTHCEALAVTGLDPKIFCSPLELEFFCTQLDFRSGRDSGTSLMTSLICEEDLANNSAVVRSGLFMQ